MRRSFPVTTTPFRFVLAIEPSYPPGDYGVRVLFDGGAHGFEIGRFTVAESRWSPRIDTTYPASEALYLAAAAADSRPSSRSTDGRLRLLPGDRAWRQLTWPERGDTLVCVTEIEGAAQHGLEIRWLDSHGECELVHRFAGPSTNRTVRRIARPRGAGVGTLEFTMPDTTPSTGAVIIDQLFFQPRAVPAPPPSDSGR